MRPRTDLEVILIESSGARRVLFGFFLLSLVLDVELVLTVAGIRPREMQTSTWTAGTYLLVGVIEVAAVMGATILWLVMLYICFHDLERALSWRVLWGVCLFLGVWWAAQIYYLFPFRRFGKGKARPES